MDSRLKIKQLIDKTQKIVIKKVHFTPCWPLCGGGSFSRYKINKIFTRFLGLL